MPGKRASRTGDAAPVLLPRLSRRRRKRRCGALLFGQHQLHRRYARQTWPKPCLRPIRASARPARGSLSLSATVTPIPPSYSQLWLAKALSAQPQRPTRVVMNMVQRRDGSNLVRIRTLMPDRIATEVPLECPDRGRVPGLCDRVPNSVSADTHLLTRSSEMP